MNTDAISDRVGELDTLLAGYASGVLSQPAHALVAAHLELCERNRAYVRALEQSLGHRVEAAPERPVAGRNARLAAIFENNGRSEGMILPECPVLPRALRALAGRPADGLEWRRLLPGVKECRIASATPVRASFYWIGAGREMPSHTHEGSEITLVLKGAFADQNGRYGRGDIAIADESVDHHPTAEAGEDCLCFAVSEAPLRLTGMIGRMLNPFIRH